MTSIIGIIVLLLQLYSFVILGRVLITWMPNLDRSNPAVKLLFDVTEPVLQPVRAMLPPMQGMDFSPLVVMIAITLLTRVIAMIA